MTRVTCIGNPHFVYTFAGNRGVPGFVVVVMKRKKQVILNIRRQFIGDPEDDLRIRATVTYLHAIRGEDDAPWCKPSVHVETSVRSHDSGPCLGTDVYNLANPAGQKDLAAEVRKFRKIEDMFRRIADALEAVGELAQHPTE